MKYIILTLILVVMGMGCVEESGPVTEEIPEVDASLQGAGDPKFSVNWHDGQFGLTHHSILVDIQNLNTSSNQPFDVTVIVSNTSYPAERTSVVIKEWKAIDTEFATYDTNTIRDYHPYPNPENTTNITNFTYPENCWNNTLNSSHYPCNRTYTYQNGTITKKKNHWKRTKALLTKEGKTVKYNYGSINIPKLGSKAKYDDFGNVETINGTKFFKVEWDTPLTRTPSGWGSSGWIAFVDETRGWEYG